MCVSFHGHVVRVSKKASHRSMERPWGYGWILFDYTGQDEYTQNMPRICLVVLCRGLVQGDFTHTLQGYITEIQTIWILNTCKEVIPVQWADDVTTMNYSTIKLSQAIISHEDTANLNTPTPQLLQLNRCLLSILLFEILTFVYLSMIIYHQVHLTWFIVWETTLCFLFAFASGTHCISQFMFVISSCSDRQYCVPGEARFRVIMV